MISSIQVPKNFSSRFILSVKENFCFPPYLKLISLNSEPPTYFLHFMLGGSFNLVKCSRKLYHCQKFNAKSLNLKVKKKN